MEVVYKKAESKEEIRNWVVLYGGRPAMINDPMVTQDNIGLRIDWPGKKDESMLSREREVTKNIGWDEFFQVMERNNLDFWFSDQEDINLTWRYKFVPRDAGLAVSEGE